MAGGAGSLRTLRISGANGSSSGGGSTMRMYKYYMSLGQSTQGFYQNGLGLRFGEFSGQSQWFTR